MQGLAAKTYAAAELHNVCMFSPGTLAHVQAMQILSNPGCVVSATVLADGTYTYNLDNDDDDGL